MAHFKKPWSLQGREDVSPGADRTQRYLVCWKCKIMKRVANGTEWVRMNAKISA